MKLTEQESQKITGVLIGGLVALVIVATISSAIGYSNFVAVVVVVAVLLVVFVFFSIVETLICFVAKKIIERKYEK